MTRYQDPIANTDGQMARTGTSHPLGTFDAKLPETLCHHELVDALRVLANAEGITASEFIRTTMEVRVFGIEHVASLQARKLQRIAGITSV